MKAIIFTVCLLAFLFTFSIQTFAVDFTVNLTTDQHDANIGDGICDIGSATGQCSLRAAAEEANAIAGNDRILFNLPANSTITLTTANGGDIFIINSGTLEIIGTGANNLTVDGGAGANRIFTISQAIVTISNLKLTGGNGRSLSNDNEGGAIYARSSLITLDSLQVTGNSAIGGGGMYTINGTSRIINSTFSANNASSGGGLVIGGTNDLIINSTFSANRTNISGGGIFGQGTNLTVVNSTISGNSAFSSGGGFYNIRGNTRLRNVTITNNVSNTGGGIYNSGSLNLGNTIVAGNISPNGSAPEIVVSDGNVTSLGGNHVGDSPGDSSNTGFPIIYQPTDIRDVNPLLGPLQNNGGVTQTHAIFTGSPAIDKGLNALAIDPSNNTTLVYDQRGLGFARIIDGNGDGTATVDIGAFESQTVDYCANSSISPTNQQFTAAGGNTTVNVTASMSCAWTATTNTNWITVTNGTSGTGNGTVALSVQANTGRARTGSVTIAGQTFTVNQAGRTSFDFDGDGRADIVVFRPSNGTWYILPSQTNAFYGFPFGQAGDQIAPADYDGDGKTDVAVFRDTVPGAGDQAYFYIRNSSDNLFRAIPFGTQGDSPMSGDWDGDGRADAAVYRAALSAGGQSYFYYRPSSQPAVNFNTIPLGTFGDKPLYGDFDGDGRLDPAVHRASTATFIILKSSLNQVTQMSFGLSTDIPVPADYDGDGITNIAVFRPSNGFWYTSQNPATNYGGIQFGANGDLPIPADYDGDGKADTAVFRPSNGGWYLNRTTSGLAGVQFGINNDKPAPNAYIR